MSSSGVVKSALFACTAFLLTGCGGGSTAPDDMADASATADAPAMADTTAMETSVGNPITGEGLPNPTTTVTRNWGTLPEGRQWGSTAGIDIDPIDGHIWAYERCGAGALDGGDVDCETNAVDPIFKFDRNTGEILANFGADVFVTPHGIHVDSDGNVWVTDFAGNDAGTRGHQVHKFSPDGELLMSIGVAGQPGSEPGQLNQPNDVIVAPDGSIFVSDGHDGQGDPPYDEGATGRIIKFAADGTYIKEWGQIGSLHGEFRTPHAMKFDDQGRLWVVDRGNHRLEIFDQEGNYLDSRYMYGRISDIFISGGMVYAIDSESSPARHFPWMNGVRIGPVDEDRITGFIPPHDADTRPYQGAAGEGVAVDADGNVYAAEGPNSLRFAGGAFTKYAVAAQ